MKEQTILVLPAEGDSAETEAIYIRHLKQHYETAGLKLNVVCPAGKYEMRSEDCLNFADDPNPFNNPEIDAIKKSSTEVMRSNPRIFKDQIKFISNWNIGNWTADRNNIDYFYVPNGRSKRPEWWDNSFNRAKAVEFWYRHGVPNTTIPDNYFSVYSMMPAESLFAVMDKVRTF